MDGSENSFLKIGGEQFRGGAWRFESSPCADANTDRDAGKSGSPHERGPKREGILANGTRDVRHNSFFKSVRHARIRRNGTSNLHEFLKPGVFHQLT